ncbi:cytochrome oxidase assembly protein ShyY1 [Mycobacteroides chelonae]|nr:cytochrome oxidase assembly protein ShyY1 [Mycobacteroides chelonae]
MRKLAFLLRPGWIALALVVVAFAYLCFTVLAPWQLGKNTKTSRENNRIAQSVSADPVPLNDELRADYSMPEDSEWRRVTATGHYLPDQQVLARLRVVEAKPAYEALTVFQVDGGPAILVNRGYVRPEQGTSVPPIPAAPTGQVTLNARLREPEQQSDKAPFPENGQYQVYSIVPQQVSTLLKAPLAGPYLQLSENQPGGLSAIPLPQLEAGPFLSYGIQWIAFGILAPIGLGYFVFSEIRQRRAATAAAKAARPGVPQTTEERMADRYGRR